jgi:DNA-binding NtrC family response regulator
MPRILIVDDEKTVAQSLHDGLACLDGCEIQISTGVEQAMSLLAQHPFDLLITDYWMPFMTGLTLVDHVQELYPRTAIIMLTGQDSSWLRGQVASTRVAYVLEKPISILEIRRIVTRTLAP